jgi:hypothetical protein
LKFMKIFTHFQRHSADIVYFPCYILYGYWCTPVKIWAILTWWNASWATAKVCEKRPQTEVEVAQKSTRRVEDTVT